MIKFVLIASKVKGLLVELAADLHCGLAGAQLEGLGAADHHVGVARVASRALQNVPNIGAAEAQRAVVV